MIHNIRIRSVVTLSVRLAAVLLFAGGTRAQITVTTASDENNTPAGAQVSLREAIRDSPDGGHIVLSQVLSGQVLVLSAGEIPVGGKTVTVAAPGGFVIEARGRSRIFRLEAGAELNLSGLTLQGGSAQADGGAVLNAGTLSLTDCVLRDNRAADGTVGVQPPARQAPPEGIPGGMGGTGSGGGAISSNGSLTLLRCRFTGNVAGEGGGGGQGGNVINVGPSSWPGGTGGTGGTGGAGGAILSTGSLVLTECIFESNRSGKGGKGGAPGLPAYSAVYRGNGGNAGDGGAVSHAGSLTADRCTFTGNSCPPGAESAETNFGNNGKLGTTGSGAAVSWTIGTATLTNCTVTANTVGESLSIPGERGGAIAAGTGTLLRLVHCTVAKNLASRFYSAVHGSYPDYSPWNAAAAAGIVSAAPVQCENCILSGNLVNQSGTSEAPVWEEINFSLDTPRAVIPFGPLGGIPGTDAILAPLALTTGPLPVLVPGAASPALNVGAILSIPPVTDQRGLPRAAGNSDLGAVEVQPSEPAPRAPQSITFLPPASPQTATVTLTATASGGLPVAFELLSGPAALNGQTLTFTAPGFITVRATQPGDTATAPAPPVTRVIEATHFIPFTPADSYTVYPQNPAIIQLPAATLGGLPVVWSLVGTPGAGTTLTGNQLTATSAGSVQIRGQNPGNAQYAPLDSTWTLTFVAGAVWWDTPPTPFGGPHWHTLVEGSPHGLSMTARIAAPHTGNVPVPPLPAGVIATPAFIPAGQTSVQCQITLTADPLLTNHSELVATGNPTVLSITLFLANRRNVPLDVLAPSRVLAGVSTAIEVSIPGVPMPGIYAPPPDLSRRSFTVAAFDYDNPAVSLPVTLNSVTAGNAPFVRVTLRLTFSSVNRRARLVVTTDDGITGTAGPVHLLTDINADGDGINDLVEAALQRPADQFNPPPLVIVRQGAGLYAVLDRRPLDLRGWSIAIELSPDLVTWSPAPENAITMTPNPDGITERVSVLLPAGAAQSARLRVSPGNR